MRRKIKPIDPNELFDADDINRTSIKGEMRKLYSAIHQKLTEGGWSARDVVTWMDERGISMTVELFRVYLNDLDREQGYSRSKNELHPTSKKTPSASTSRQPQSTVAATAAISKAAVPAAANTELVRPPGITDDRWSEMKAKARAENRKQNQIK